MEFTRDQHCTHPNQDWCDCDWCRFLREEARKANEAPLLLLLPKGVK